jgi:hypothetical protein
MKIPEAFRDTGFQSVFLCTELRALDGVYRTDYLRVELRESRWNHKRDAQERG